MNARIKSKQYNPVIIGVWCILCVMTVIVMNGNSADAEQIPSPPVQTTPPPVQSVTSGNYEYQVIDGNNKAAWLTKVRNYGEEVELPSVIDGYNIVGIGLYKAEWYNDYNGPTDFEKVTLFSKENDTIIRKLVIPKGVAAIEAYAFNEMSGLEYLELPDSLRRIGPYNFRHAMNIKSLVMSGGVSISEHCFEASIDRLTVKRGKADSDYMSGMRFENIGTLTGDGTEVSLGFESAHIKELAVKARVKTIYLTGKYDNVILENDKTKVIYDQEDAEVGKISAQVSNIKVKKKSGKYIYSWKPLNILVTKQTYGNEAGVIKYNPKSKIRYTVKIRNKKIRTLKNTTIQFNKKKKVKAEAVCILPEGRFWDFKK